MASPSYLLGVFVTGPAPVARPLAVPESPAIAITATATATTAAGTTTTTGTTATAKRTKRISAAAKAAAKTGHGIRLDPVRTAHFLFFASSLFQLFGRLTGHAPQGDHHKIEKREHPFRRQRPPLSSYAETASSLLGGGSPFSLWCGRASFAVRPKQGSNKILKILVVDHFFSVTQLYVRVACRII